MAELSKCESGHGDRRRDKSQRWAASISNGLKPLRATARKRTPQAQSSRSSAGVISNDSSPCYKQLALQA